jgi:hypothetical protein
MSEIESVETRDEARQGWGQTATRLLQIVAAVAILVGLSGAIYSPHSASLVVAFLAFVVYLVSDYLRRK